MYPHIHIHNCTHIHHTPTKFQKLKKTLSRTNHKGCVTSLNPLLLLLMYMWCVTCYCCVCACDVCLGMCVTVHMWRSEEKFWGVASLLPPCVCPTCWAIFQAASFLCGVLLTPPHKCILETWNLLIKGLVRASSHSLSGVSLFPQRFFHQLLWQEKKKETLFLMNSYRMYKPLVYLSFNQLC